MAKQANFVYRVKKKIKRRGRHSKKASLLKNSKTYKKLYRGQGK
jgi:hypothetical protein